MGLFCPEGSHHTKPPNNDNSYTDVFDNYSGAIQSDGDYQTYGLVDTFQGIIRTFYILETSADGVSF